MNEETIKYADEELALINPQRMALTNQIALRRTSDERDLAQALRRSRAAETRLAELGPDATSVQRGAVQKLVEKRTRELELAQKRLAVGAAGKNIKLRSLEQEAAHLERYRELAKSSIEDIDLRLEKVIQGNQYVEIDGVMFPPGLNEYSRQMISADESVGNIFNTAKQLTQGHLERSFDHGAKPISAGQNEVEHAQAWARAINYQIMQDPLQVRFVRDATFTVEDAVRWMTTDVRGIAYRRRLPKMVRTEDLARSMKYEVDQYMHIPEIRLKALEGDVTPEFLKRVAPHLSDRPDVHIAQMGLAQLRHMNVMDRNIQRWFNFAATLPANRMSRHPLFNQQYEGHLKTLVAQRQLHGRPVTVDEVEDVADVARQLALRDTRRLVFDIAHRSDASAALRFMSPFFTATQEAFTRWARIIVDRPQVAGYAAAWYNAPLQTSGMNVLGFRFGGMQTQDGMPLTSDGKYLDPETGTFKTASKVDRFIITRAPKWFTNSPLGKAMNMTAADGTVLLSQNSMNLVTQGDPWFNPGVGPIVQIPVNEFVKDKPKAAEIARHLSILPYGPHTGNALQRTADQLLPGSVRNFMVAWDTSDSRYQMIKLQITNQAIYEHENLGKKMPTAGEIAKRTRNYWLFSASAAFLQPMATQRKDPYQFFYDQYNALRRQDPRTADEQFLRRYGESHFIFATSLSKTLTGVPSTMKGYELGKRYEKIIQKMPELGALVVGPEGNGPFSPEVYSYQLNHPIEPGSAEMERRRLNADEVLRENRKRLGWQKYVARMNQLTAQLHDRGLLSFEEQGAEDLLADKRAYTKLYSEPLYPDGSKNPYYIQEWAEDFKSKDPDHYDKLIPALTDLSRSELADLPERTDLRTLQKYLGGRRALLAQLEERRAAGEPHTLEAMANRDLRFRWIYFVDGLVESDTRFGDLYNRYLGRDLGVDVESESEVVVEGGLGDGI